MPFNKNIAVLLVGLLLIIIGFEFVAITGYGVNDAAPLEQSDVGIAVGPGTDVAAETADIFLINSNPQDMPILFCLEKPLTKR